MCSTFLLTSLCQKDKTRLLLLTSDLIWNIRWQWSGILTESWQENSTSATRFYEINLNNNQLNNSGLSNVTGYSISLPISWKYAAILYISKFQSAVVCLNKLTSGKEVIFFVISAAMQPIYCPRHRCTGVEDPSASIPYKPSIYIYICIISSFYQRKIKNTNRTFL